MRVFLFDIDGTLIYANPYSAPPMSRAFKDIYKIDNILDKIPHAGTTDIKIARDAIKLATGRDADIYEINEFLDLFVSYLKNDSDNLPSPVILPGVKEILVTLANNNNNLLALQTGNLETSAWLKLEKSGLAEYFKTGGFASDSESRPELVKIAFEKCRRNFNDQIQAENVYVIGDTPYDITAGHENGFKVIAVASGKFSNAELAELRPFAVFNDMLEVNAALNSILNS